MRSTHDLGLRFIRTGLSKGGDGAIMRPICLPGRRVYANTGDNDFFDCQERAELFRFPSDSTVLRAGMRSVMRGPDYRVGQWPPAGGRACIPTGLDAGATVDLAAPNQGVTTSGRVRLA